MAEARAEQINIKETQPEIAWQTLYCMWRRGVRTIKTVGEYIGEDLKSEKGTFLKAQNVN